MTSIAMVGEYVWLYQGAGLFAEQYHRNSLIGQALVELHERRGADAAASDAQPDEDSEPVTPMTAAIEACVVARDEVKAALCEAITTKAHFTLSNAIVGLTQVLAIVESARKADAS